MDSRESMLGVCMCAFPFKLCSCGRKSSTTYPYAMLISFRLARVASYITPSFESRYSPA
jgi:hypothetical protein